MEVKITYNTMLPLQGFNPKVDIIDKEKNLYYVVFIDRINGNVIASGSVESNGWISAMRQWFTYWRINIYKGKEKVYTEDFNPYNKNVFIKIDAKALGDNLAWMPYIEEFRLKHKCNVICSTFFNELFENEYPNLLFVKPNTQITNIYAQYYIGTVKPDNNIYSPRPYGKIPLQETATDILGLEHKEICCKITKPKVSKTKSVCISEKGSTKLKEWDGNWQIVVDYLISEGYEVKVISKEPTELKNITNKTGNISLSDRIKDLCESEFFIGVSSGLSWLAHSCETYVFIISDHTPQNHEFSDNCTRIYSDKCRTEVIQESVKSNITTEQIIEEIKKLNVTFRININNLHEPEMK
jgi:autotransporter strand-loop-strand O-heptosyltransferase